MLLQQHVRCQLNIIFHNGVEIILVASLSLDSVCSLLTSSLVLAAFSSSSFLFSP